MHDHPDIIIIRMTAILVSRFLLDLQAASQNSLKLARDDPLYSSRIGDSEDNGQGVGSLVFAGFDVVGSLGASLSPSEHASDGMDDEEFGEADNSGEAIQEDTASGERDAAAEPALEAIAPVASVGVPAASSVWGGSEEDKLWCGRLSASGGGTVAAGRALP